MKPKNKSYKAIFVIAALLCIGSMVSEVQAQDGYEPGPDVISNIPKVQERIKDGADLASDVPKGIENIGRDMIILVDRIIFGEQDPTQRLDIQPLLQDIYTALDMSPIIKKAEVKMYHTLKAMSVFNFQTFSTNRNPLPLPQVPFAL